MNYKFCIQDPSDENSSYLYELLVEQLEMTTLLKWRGIYAFATGSAVNTLFFNDPSIKSFAKRGKIELLVGIDAVTNESALQRLKAVQEAYDNVDVKVFLNSAQGLFHPKVSHFSYQDDHSVVILGSGNLTTGGLRRNIEAYSIVEGTPDELYTISAWENFIARHSAEITEIDERALQRAKENFIRQGKPLKREAVREDIEVPPLTPGRVLLAEVPRAGGRWSQVHFNVDIVQTYFRIKPHTGQRLFLQDVSAQDSEEVRPIVYSESNKNYKIEVGAAQDRDYPVVGRPILVLKEVAVRSFRYALLMPEDSEYEEVALLLSNLPSVGKGLKRSITTFENLIKFWPAAPL